MVRSLFAVRALLLLVLLGGCAVVPPPVLYVLKPAGVTVSVPAVKAVVGVALGPLTVPEYLDRSDMVRRATDNRLVVSDRERWAETLRSGMQRVLAIALADRLGAGYWLAGAAARAAQVELELPIEVESFEIDADGLALLAVRWELRATRDEKVLERGRKRYQRSARPDQVEDQVRVLSALLDEFAADLAAAVRRR
ncbi:putative Membrane integrity-associated transporter subunit PqiC [uncultured Gammaproteobacteria bacterium]